MSSTLIAIIGFVYLYIAGENFYKGESAIGIMFLGYAFANVGSYLLTKG